MDIQRQRIYRAGIPVAAGVHPAQYRMQQGKPTPQTRAVSAVNVPVPLPELSGCSYPSLAMVYAPDQPFDGLFDRQTALIKGTAFEALDLPFAGGRWCR